MMRQYASHIRAVSTSVVGKHLAAMVWPFRKSGMSARNKSATRAAGRAVRRLGDTGQGPGQIAGAVSCASEAASGANSKRAKYFLNLPTIKGCVGGRFARDAAIRITHHGRARQRVWQTSGGSGVAVQKTRNEHVKQECHTSSRPNRPAPRRHWLGPRSNCQCGRGRIGRGEWRELETGKIFFESAGHQRLRGRKLRA